MQLYLNHYLTQKQLSSLADLTLYIPTSTPTDWRLQLEQPWYYTALIPPQSIKSWTPVLTHMPPNSSGVSTTLNGIAAHYILTEPAPAPAHISIPAPHNFAMTFPSQLASEISQNAHSASLSITEYVRSLHPKTKPDPDSNPIRLIQFVPPRTFELEYDPLTSRNKRVYDSSRDVVYLTVPLDQQTFAHLLDIATNYKIIPARQTKSLTGQASAAIEAMVRGLI